MTETASEKLAACPFCGTEWEDSPDSELELYSANVGWCVHCHGCGIETRGYPTRSEAIAVWNTRTPPSEEVVEALEEARPFVLSWTQEHGKTATHAQAMGNGALAKIDAAIASMKGEGR
jgi:hypothetical protein